MGRHEYRIQITSGVRAFELEPDGKTLILGWGEQFGVFAAFDASRRTGPLGASPSIQISERTLSLARDQGVAVQDKGDREFAIAIRPDHLTSYIGHLESAHGGDISAIVAERASEDTSDDEILDKASGEDAAFHFGNTEELAQRRSVLKRLEALEREIASLRPAAAGRGHNNPPELLQPEDQTALANEIQVSAEEIRLQLEKPQPDVSKVAVRTKFFRWLAGALRGAKDEAGKLGQKVKEKARERLAEIVVSVFVSGAAFWTQVAHLIEAVVAEILKWLHLIL